MKSGYWSRVSSNKLVAQTNLSPLKVMCQSEGSNNPQVTSDNFLGAIYITNYLYLTAKEWYVEDIRIISL